MNFIKLVIFLETITHFKNYTKYIILHIYFNTYYIIIQQSTIVNLENKNIKFKKITRKNFNFTVQIIYNGILLF